MRERAQTESEGEVPDEPPTSGEIWRRMDRLERQQHQHAQDCVPASVYTRDRAEWERQRVEMQAAFQQAMQALQQMVHDEKQERREGDRHLDAELEAERQARQVGDKELREKSSTSGRQVLFQGVLPALLMLATIAVSIVLATRGAK